MSRASHSPGHIPGNGPILGAGIGRQVHLPLQPTEAALTIVTDALGRIRYGDIRLTVHEGRLVQVDVTEKTRLPQS